MIKINDQEYENSFFDERHKAAILKIAQEIDERVEEVLNDEETLKGSSISEIKNIMKEENILIANKVLLSSFLFLNKEPNDYIVFLIDLQEKFIKPPSLTRIIYSLYPEGFYTKSSLKERVEWIKRNKSKLKNSRLVKYFNEKGEP